MEIVISWRVDEVIGGSGGEKTSQSLMGHFGSRLRLVEDGVEHGLRALHCRAPVTAGSEMHGVFIMAVPLPLLSPLLLR